MQALLLAGLVMISWAIAEEITFKLINVKSPKPFSKQGILYDLPAYIFGVILAMLVFSGWSFGLGLALAVLAAAILLVARIVIFRLIDFVELKPWTWKAVLAELPAFFAGFLVVVCFH